MSGRYSRRRYIRSRSYKAWPKRSSLIRRSLGNMKAAKRQNDISNTTLSGSSLAYIIKVPADKVQGFQTFNIWNALNDSPMFRTLRKCYDQIRINNVKVKFSLLQALSMTGSNCPVFGTIWDRNGFHPEQYDPDTTDYLDGKNFAWRWDKFASYSSFEKRSMSSGSAFNCTVSIAPSNMAEKSMYVSTADISTPSGDGSDSSEICSPISNPALPFKPQIVTGIYAVAAVAEQSFVFSVDWEIDASFRGMHASVDQDVTTVERLTHWLPTNESPATLDNMAGAQRMSVGFTRQPNPATAQVPTGNTMFIVDYIADKDLWKLSMLRNNSGVSKPATLNTGSYYMLANALYLRMYLGKGGLASHPVQLSVYAEAQANDSTWGETFISANIVDLVMSDD